MTFDRETFFAGVRTFLKSQGMTLTQKRTDALEFLVGRFEQTNWTIPEISYALGTIFHETAHTFEPIYEYGPKSYFNKYEPGTRIGKNLGNIAQGDGYLYRGAGYVQITGRSNYRKFGIENDPQEAIKPDTAFRILHLGMQKGMFTGKKLSDYISDTGKDYKNARKIINGLDKAGLIAGYANQFEEILRAARSNSASALPQSVPDEQSATVDPTDKPAPTDQPTETKLTESTEKGDTIVTASVTTPAGDAPDVEPTVVTKNGPLAKWLFSSGTLGMIGTAVWAWITGNASIIAVAVICITALIAMFMFRGAITDAIRMQVASDPNKKNVS